MTNRQIRELQSAVYTEDWRFGHEKLRGRPEYYITTRDKQRREDRGWQVLDAKSIEALACRQIALSWEAEEPLSYTRLTDVEILWHLYKTCESRTNRKWFFEGLYHTPVCASQSCAILSYFTHEYIPGHKRKIKQTVYIFCISTLLSFSVYNIFDLVLTDR